MASVMYHLSAACLPRNNVVLYITTDGVPLHTSPDDTTALWQDIVQCFAQEYFPKVAEILQTLPYTRNSFGAFDIRGPRRRRQEVFRLLAHPLKPQPGVVLSVSVKFRRTPHQSRFNVHYWVGRIWDTDHVMAPPIFEGTDPEAVASPFTS